jgi:hypothetical protein
MSWGIVAAVGASVVGGAMASDAAGDAADTQAASADRATAAEREMFERQVQLQQPWRDFGGAGVNRLAYEMGLSPTGFYGQGGAPMNAPLETEAQVRARLRAQYPIPQAGSGAYAAPAGTVDEGGQVPSSTGGLSSSLFQNPALAAKFGMTPGQVAGQTAQPGATAPYDDSAYEAAVRAEMARIGQIQQQQATATAGAATDPAYGNLLRNFGRSDFEVDPGYQFRLEEGEKAMQRAASTQGGIGSGKFLKDAMRFNQGMATDEYSRAFDRYNLNRDSKFNKLASVAGIGQTATNQTAAAAGNFGSQWGNNIIGAGNAQAAGRVGSANAWGNAISQGASMYQGNQMMNRMFPTGGASGGWGTGINPGPFTF